MGSIYILQHIDFNRLKIGYSTQDMQGLHSRYVTSFGNDVEFLTFRTEYPVEIEKDFQTKFINKCITNELYQKEYLEEYICYLKEVTNEEPCLINSEILRNRENKGLSLDDRPCRYICPRCHYSSSKKCNLLDHLNRKTICPSKYSDMCIDDIKDKIVKDAPEYNKTHKCDQCDKSFSHTSGLTRHIKSHVSVTNNNISNIDNSVDTTNNTDNHDTINLLPYGQENTTQVEDDTDFMSNCLTNMSTIGIPNMVEKIFYNKDVPENHNVKVKRQHHPSTMKVYTGSEWEERDLNIVIADIIYKCTQLLMKHSNILSNGETNNDLQKEINNINGKKRGTYGSIKNGVFNKAMEYCRKNKT